jgi:hypothetical protein
MKALFQKDFIDFEFIHKQLRTAVLVRLPENIAENTRHFIFYRINN